MVEEEVAAAATSPAPSDLKRKHQDLEPEAPEPNVSVNGKESDSIERAEEEGKEEEEAVPGGDDSVESEAKRPRLEEEEEEKPDSLVTQNGFQEDKVKEPVEEDEKQTKESNTEKAPERVDDEQPSTDGQQAADIHPLHSENSQSESAQPPPSGVELEESFAEVPPLANVSSEEQPPASETQTMSRKMEVPNNKVGVLIGKAGDTIRFLQINSGAKIQIMRDADSDPHSTTRPVELIGSFESINKAEKLIKDVIAEADAGGSPSLVARGFSTAGAIEQVLIQVPNEKVGVIIGKGGETIKNLQTRSGARIQLTPQHLPEGDQSKERTVRVSGDKKQIEMARELIKEVMSQNVRPSSSGGYNQQAFRPRGPASQPQWGSRAPNAGRPTGYDYQQRGPYPSQVPQYPPHGYGNHPPQAGSRSSYGPGWEQRPPTMQGPPHQSGGYDYYGAQGQMVGAPASAPHSNPVPAHGPGPSPAHMGPHSQGNYNYGQPHGQPAQYPAQGYGHGYGETKYENHGPSHHAYGGHGGAQPQGSHPGFAPHDQYGKAPPSYGMPPHGPPAQTYGQPRVSQPGDVPYQGGPISSTQQSYGQNAPPPQQTYPYATSGPSPQTYAPYGPASATEGYNQQQPITGSAQTYPQQSAQPVPGYGQPGGQQQPGYAQAGSAGGYGSYPTMQPGYTEQPSQTNAGYGYQGAADPAYVGAPGSAYGAAPQTGQAVYAQPVPAQPGYDQTVPPSSGYGGVAGGMPAGYGKSASPNPGYPQYDTTQMYGAPR